jgi:hypothetical protein
LHVVSLFEHKRVHEDVAVVDEAAHRPDDH